ncbi:MBL fold metallo-hydrolase [Breznakiella homolactica]|uniref:MBL fold metallo-hydrolase n=1 Tax=Breznakiella homolactica TaxID=2798577 RepID=A0A7T8B9M9_9SPIR|nr:MBL fold metallo-hydrolase [Breznakiella homolactica]QQO08120.1 MBL fold metallo-hydrolase [Breznakiella homolactica]
MQNQTEQTSLYPMVEFKENTFELDEFDCASIFVLVGTEKALVIDTGMGIGNLRRAVERITKKPVTVVITHAHVDHIQNTHQWGECYINELDMPMFVDDVERRKYDAKLIAKRQGGIYAYDLDRDITPWTCQPVLNPLVEGQSFDLGGGRIITAYWVPGHSKGHMMFLDEQSRSLFAGDSLNNNLGVAGTMDPSKPNYVGIKGVLGGLEKMKALEGSYDGIYNGHHDFRALGLPLDQEVLPNAIDICHQILDGTCTVQQKPNPLHNDRTMNYVQKGNSWLSINPDFI